MDDVQVLEGRKEGQKIDDQNTMANQEDQQVETGQNNNDLRKEILQTL